MFQYDAARSGHNPTTTGPSGAVSIRWKQTIANATFGASPPVVNDGTVFVGGRGEAETLFALDASSGEVRWQVEKVGGFNSPAVAYDTVYAPATNSRLYAYDPADGSERWQFKADNEARHTAIADGRVYLGTSGSVFALDAGTGDELWRTSLNRTGNEFAHGGGRLLLTVTGGIEALDESTGESLWSVDAPRSLGAPTVTDDVAVVTSPLQGEILGLDVASGDARWRTTPDSVPSLSAAVADGTLYFATDHDDTILVLDAETGEQRRRLSLDTDGLAHSSVVVVDGVLYVGNYDASDAGSMHALDQATGKQLWEMQTSGPVSAPPAVVEGTVFVTAEATRNTEATLYAIESS